MAAPSQLGIPNPVAASPRAASSKPAADPHIDLTGFGIIDLMYTYLYSWRPSAEEAVLNNFVTEMEIPDATHFNFTLRQGVMNWPVGPAADEELNSTDCKESFLRRGTALTAPDKRYPQRFLHGGGRLETADPYTFNIVLDRPFIPALQDMANSTWAIVPGQGDRSVQQPQPDRLW
ncbi:MAG: hypothetical protein V3S00_02380 [Dehalococcoidia bacterium]